MASLDKDSSVGVITLGEGENRLTQDLVAEVNAYLDEVEAGPLTAVVTAAVGKIWSNGLDTDWFAANPETAGAGLANVERLFVRVLTFGKPAVAAVQGHAFAGGYMLAIAHDARVMRTDRGFVCLPEVDLGVAFSPGMTALLRAKLAPATAHAAMAFGRRFGGPDALAAGMVDEIADADDVLGRAVALAGSLGGRDPVIFSAIKRRMYADAVELLGLEPGPETVAALVAIASRA